MSISKTSYTLVCIALFIQLVPSGTAGIEPTSSEVSETAISNSQNSLQTQTCNCDIYKTICDDRCCCDTRCPTDTIKMWKKQGLCLNQEFIYSLSTILPCSHKFPKTLSDLQGGLRIYYRILKILFCVAFDNSEDSDRYKEPQSAEKLDIAVELTTPVNYTKPTDVYLQKQSTSDANVYEMFTLSRPGFGSLECSDQGVLLYNNLEPKECFYKMTLDNFCADSAFADPDSYPSATVRLGSSNSFIMTKRNTYVRNIAKIGFTNNPSFPTSAILKMNNTDNTVCTCTNFVSEVHYQLLLDSNNAIQAATFDLVITDEETFACSGKVAVKQKTSFFFVTAAVEYPKLKGPGYRFGDPLTIGIPQSNGSATVLVVEAFLQPLNFNYINLDGTCAQVSSTGVNDNIDDRKSSSLQFGHSQVLSCSLKLNRADLTTFCAKQSLQVLMYRNIANNFQYIAQFPNANPNYIKDWVLVDNYVTPTSTDTASLDKIKICSINTPRISIYYSAIGDQVNPGYKINAAEVSFMNTEDLTFTLTDENAQQTFNLKTYVSFIKQPQSAESFVAPNPTVKFSLPDNVLTPFITKK